MKNTQFSVRLDEPILSADQRHRPVYDYGQMRLEGGGKQ